MMLVSQTVTPSRILIGDRMFYDLRLTLPPSVSTASLVLPKTLPGFAVRGWNLQSRQPDGSLILRGKLQPFQVGHFRCPPAHLCLGIMTMGALSQTTVLRIPDF